MPVPLSVSEWLMCLPSVLCLLIYGWAKLFRDQYKRISDHLATGITDGLVVKIPCIICVLAFRAILVLCVPAWAILVYLFPALCPVKQPCFDTTPCNKSSVWAPQNRYLMSLAEGVEAEILAQRQREANELASLKAERERAEREERAKERAQRAGLLPPSISPYVVRSFSDLNTPSCFSTYPGQTSTSSNPKPLPQTPFTPSPPRNDSTWTPDTSPSAYKSAAADLSRSLHKPDSFRATDLSPSLQQCIVNRGTAVYDQPTSGDSEHHAVADLPAWMRSGDHHVAYSVGRTDDGRYFVNVLGLPSMYLDPQGKTYVPLHGFREDEATATEMVRRRLQGY